MNIQELSQWTDEQVFNKTGKHLDTLQKRILEGTLRSQKYPKIAENNSPYTSDYIKEQGAKLWKLLAEVFEEEGIKQSNVRSILENKFADNIYNFSSQQIICDNGTINICSEKTPYLEKKHNSVPENKKEYPIIDLTEAPAINYNIDRLSEIKTLKK